MPPDRIALCGFMGAGKSKVGAALAAQLNYQFADLDSEIERSEGRTIAAIFADAGETYFRELESMIGCKLLSNSNIVVALGGGAISDPAILTAIQSDACLIYLRAEPDILWERIKHRPDRPLAASLTSLAEFMKLYEDRMKIRQPIYEQANIIVDTGRTPVADTVTAILQQLQERT